MTLIWIPLKKLKAETKNYALTFIDYFGNEQLINSNYNITSLEEKPLYKSLENAKKSQKSLRKGIERNYLSVLLHWRDKAYEEGFDGIDLTEHEIAEVTRENWGYRAIKDYEDALLIIENGLNIREVSIKLI